MSGAYLNGQLPLAGTILCCTSIAPEQRSTLANIGSQMGATIKLDLTSDVTHLIVGSINSAKYRYVAKSREDVKVLSPEWLEAVRAVWMEGDDVDVAALEEKHRLPAFYGLKICLTGFDNPEERKFIQETVNQQGAEYHGDLTKSVTHLIAATPAGKKYEHARSWKMKIVSWEWFKQSLERGMALDEAYFDPRMPAEERGQGAWDKQSMSPALGKRTRDMVSQPENPLRRKLRRSASTKFGSQSEALWAGITSASFDRKRNEEDEWTEDNSLLQAAPEREAPSMHVNEDVSQDHVPRADPAAPSRRPLPFDQNDGIFDGRVIYPFGFDEVKTKILRDVLDSNGATVIHNAADLDKFESHDIRRGYLVVPHDVQTDLTSLPRGAEHLSVATNWWIERCLHGKSLVVPTEHVLCRPFDELSISGFENLSVHITAFSGIELLHVTKVISLMGATYDENLSTKTSVMVSNSWKPNPDKAKFVADKRIPAVHATWLWDCIRTGELKPFDGYLLNKTSQLPRQETPRASHSEVPTARLSKEDSFKLAQKKAHTARHVSKPRVGPQRAQSLVLAVSADPTPASAIDISSNTGSSTHDSSLDQDDPIGIFDGPSSYPLKDINPGVNSPRRPSTSSNASTTHVNTKNNSTSTSDAPLKQAPAPRRTRLGKEPSPDSVIPPDSILEPEEKREKDYSSIMSALLSNRKTAPNPADKEEEKRKRRRQLGRAQSSRSNASTADDVLSRTGSLDVNGEDDTEERAKAKPIQYQPSQELGWDAPGAQEARAQMIRAIGGKVEEGTSVMEGIGIVKDSMSEVPGPTRSRKRRG